MALNVIDIDWLPDFSQHKEWHIWLNKAKFNQTKADKTGKFTQEKNCYAKPLLEHLCYFLSLGCWISLNAKRLASTENLFLSPEKNLQCLAMVLHTTFWDGDETSSCGQKSSLSLSFQAHGLWKGSGSHGSSATTLPALLLLLPLEVRGRLGKFLTFISSLHCEAIGTLATYWLFMILIMSHFAYYFHIGPIQCICFLRN